jgi:ABC-2 type transport system ATP-binding protein
MQRRIGLAQALINDPDLVILDEPTAGLDPIGCREIKDLIVALAKRGKTVILSSHLLSDVEDVCDRVVIYYGGRIQAKGTLQELLTTPDVTRITTPVLKRETMSRVLEIIRSEVREDAVSVDNPTQNLESYFLGVVERARAEETTTSGAVAGGVADYLRADEKEEHPSQDKMLDRLTVAENKRFAATPVQTPSKDQVDHSKLDQLAQGQGSAPKTTESAGIEQAQQKLDEANDKLSSLLDDSPDSSKPQS